MPKAKSQSKERVRKPVKTTDVRTRTNRNAAATKRPVERARPQAKGRSALKRRAVAAPAQSKVQAKSADAGLAFRLSPSLRARAYRLHFEVDPSESARYRGRVEIDAMLDRAQHELELHASELRLLSAKVHARGEQVASVTLHPQRETATLSVDKPLPKGKLTIELSFEGELRGDLRGLYAAQSGDNKYAFTQLQAADARRFFPCLDEPDQKASFQLSVRTSSANTVISNNPVARTETHDDGTQTVHFSPTPPMSSYLVALAVGALVCSEPVFADGIAIRVVHTPGSEHMTEFALDAARESLLRLREYFAIPYPYEKLDLVAVPDFEIGAMENAGAVFFRETLLLVDEASVSLAEKKRAAEVICHELAHMWYGNLVTMRWWDDLWLNEAFATWMAFDIVAKWRPEWQMWNDFGHARNSALHLDALENTHPIYTPVHTPSEATENFDLITYEKGAAVVRMLERYLGPAVFQRGVRRYIKRHRESNTVASDLWNALSEAAKQDVEKVVRPFLDQPGFPLVRVTLQRPKKTRNAKATAAAQPLRVKLSQERFAAEGPGASSHDSSVWPVPWVGRVGRGGRGGRGEQSTRATFTRTLLTKTKATVALPSGSVRYLYGNADEGGFFRPLHASADLPALLEALPELGVAERLGFVQHQWALLRAGYTGLADFLPLVSALAQEPDADVLRALHAPMEHLLDDIALSAGAATHARLRELIVRTFEPALRTLSWQARDGEPESERLRRAELVHLVAVLADNPSDCEEAEHQFQQYMASRAQLDPNLIGPVLTLGARRADAARLHQLLDASETDSTPQARRRFRLALADVREPELAETVLTLCLGPRIPTQDVAFVVARLLRNPAVQERAFEFIQTRWPELRERIPAMLMSRLIDAAPALRAERHRRSLQQFFRKHPLPTAARALRQADERFRLDAAFRKRAAPELRSLLSAAASPAERRSRR